MRPVEWVTSLDVPTNTIYAVPSAADRGFWQSPFVEDTRPWAELTDQERVAAVMKRLNRPAYEFIDAVAAMDEGIRRRAFQHLTADLLVDNPRSCAVIDGIADHA